MFELSNRLFQQGAVSPLFLRGRGSGGVLPKKISASMVIKCWKAEKNHVEEE